MSNTIGSPAVNWAYSSARNAPMSTILSVIEEEIAREYPDVRKIQGVLADEEPDALMYAQIVQMLGSHKDHASAQGIQVRAALDGFMRAQLNQELIDSQTRLATAAEASTQANMRLADANNRLTRVGNLIAALAFLLAIIQVVLAIVFK